MAEVMKSSSSSSTLCRGAQPSRETLQYQEAGRQEKVILGEKSMSKGVKNRRGHFLLE